MPFHLNQMGVLAVFWYFYSGLLLGFNLFSDRFDLFWPSRTASLCPGGLFWTSAGVKRRGFIREPRKASFNSFL